MANVTVINRARVEGFRQNADGVEVSALDLDSGQVFAIDCRYVVGCDGGRSGIRREIGARLAGDEVIQRVQSSYIRCDVAAEILFREAAHAGDHP